MPIEGVAEAWPARAFELKAVEPDAPTGQLPVWQNVTAERYARVTGLAALPLVLQQTSNTGDGLARDWPAPGAGATTNRMYSLQWYSFAALAVVLYGIFFVRARRRV